MTILKDELIKKLATEILDNVELQQYVKAQVQSQYEIAEIPEERDDSIEAYRKSALESYVISHVLNCVIAELDHSFK